MLEGVMDISDQRVRDIMIPRSQIVTLKRNQTLDECPDVIIDSAHSRFPVISEDKDHIEGLLMAKDLLPFMRSDSEEFSIDKVLRRRLLCRKVSVLTVCLRSSAPSAIIWRL